MQNNHSSLLNIIAGGPQTTFSEAESCSTMDMESNISHLKSSDHKDVERKTNEVNICDIRISPEYQLRTSKECSKALVERYSNVDADNFPPVIIAESDNSEINGILLGGHHRVKAAIENKEEKISCRYVYVATKQDALLAALQDNMQGKSLSTEELALACKSLSHAGISFEEIGAVIGRDKSTISRMIAKLDKVPVSKKSPTVKQIRRQVCGTLKSLSQYSNQVSESSEFESNDLRTAIDALNKLLKTSEVLQNKIEAVASEE